jgi:PD-(D/E)XK nuclease superfamily
MKNLIGSYPKESNFISKFRKHQGWWRTFVLKEAEGRYWDNKNKVWKQVCNRINDGNKSMSNFLSQEITDDVKNALQIQKDLKKGMMDEDRLYNNLLSSQPLAFNFFGFFRANMDVAKGFLQTIRPDIVSVDEIVFEYAPESSQDRSAFDFGFVVSTATEKGFIGFECKYTDDFSYQRTRPNEPSVYYGEEGDKNYEYYHRLYLDNPQRFPDEYHTYIRNKNYNQLFRNEILGILFKDKPDIDFVITGLFCHHDDKKSCSAGLEFQKKIGNGTDDFVLMTYSDYFERIQKLDLNWEQRELVMMLWARYCGLDLSKNILENE